MGTEAYGLVGFFVMLQAWFTLLDMGLTLTVARETARLSSGAATVLQYRSLVRALEGIFLFVAVVGGSSMLLFSGNIATDWLNTNQLSKIEVQNSLYIISFLIPVRWMGGLYRGIITGFEKLVWLSFFNVLIATIRFFGILPIFIFLNSDPSTFFYFQLVVTLLEYIILLFTAYRLMPSTPLGTKITWGLAPLKPTLKFSLTIAFTSAVWVCVTQMDKMILSGILPLSEYGYFTLAVLVAGGILVVSGPVGAALMPRMANLEALGKHTELIRLYRQSTQFIAVVAGAITTTVALGSETILLAWTGDPIISKQAAPILTLYAWGNGVLTLSAFPYYLQYAKGNLRLHLIGNAIFIVLLIPAIVVAATRYQGVGAGYVWLTINLLSFVAWLPFVHRQFEPGLNAKWYCHDILQIIVPVVFIGTLLFEFINFTTNRWIDIVILGLIGLLLLLIGCVGSSDMRKRAIAISKMS
jgi:O-antigen/teichoic acid export membrane protein